MEKCVNWFYGRRIFVGMRLGAVVAGVLMAGVAMAQEPGGAAVGTRPGFGEHRPPFERAFGPQSAQHRFWNDPKVVSQLKLTDDQRKAMDGILLEHRERLIDLRASVDKAELGMEPLMSQDQPDEGKIVAQIDQVAQARAELEKANARFLLALRGKLTGDQWKQMQALRASHAQDGHGWGHGGPGPNGQFHRGGPPAGAGPGGPGGPPSD